MLISVLAGIMLGIPTGPARFFVVDTCIKEGKRAALQVYGGLMTTKFFYAFVALLIINLLTLSKEVEALVYLIGSFVLIIWGGIIIAKSRKDSGDAIELSVDSLYKKGFLVGISNPAIPFIYLGFLQVIKAYTKETSTMKYVIDILTFEFASFLTLALVSWLLLQEKSKLLQHWGKVKFAMGLLIVSIGTYQVFQHLEFNNGIQLKDSESMLEKQAETKSLQ